jgi:hypothetical protein
MFGPQKKRSRRDRKKRPQPVNPLVAKLGPLGPNVKVIQTPPGKERMSDVLEEFIEPFIPLVPGPEGFRKLVSVAVIAWNAALLPDDERNALIEKAMDAASEDVRDDLEQVLADMIHRKLAFFADNRRTILSYQLTPGPRGPHLSVLSTLGDDGLTAPPHNAPSAPRSP